MSYVPGLFVKHLLSSLINNCEMNTEDAIKVIYEGIMDFTDEAYMFRTENDVISLEDFCLYCDDVVTDCFERGRIKDKKELFTHIWEKTNSNEFFNNEKTRRAFHECVDKSYYTCCEIAKLLQSITDDKLVTFCKYLAKGDKNRIDDAVQVIFKSVMKTDMECFHHRVMLGVKELDMEETIHTLFLHYFIDIYQIRVEILKRLKKAAQQSISTSSRQDYVNIWMQNIDNEMGGAISKIPVAEYSAELLKILKGDE